MYEFFIKGGPLMYCISFCSIVALAVFLERLFHLHRAYIDTDKFMAGIRNLLKKDKIIEALSICEETPGPVASVVRVSIAKHDKKKEDIKEAIEDVSLNEVIRLEKNIGVLATIAHITPLLGLLGTVTGMIKAFMKIQEKAGLVNPADLAQGIWEALITTAAGLVVAIPTYVAYNYLVSRVTGKIKDMERSSTEIVNLLMARKEEYEV